MKQKLITLLAFASIFAVFAVALNSCGGGGSSYGGGGGGMYGAANNPPPPAMSSVQVVPCPAAPASAVSITEYVFTGSAVHAPVGGVVMWTNNGTMQHSVTSGSPPGVPDGQFDHVLNPTQSVCLKFTTAGTYHYYCKFHFNLGMVGSVTVP